jgi:fatty-acyl-CoA synthase
MEPTGTWFPALHTESKKGYPVELSEQTLSGLLRKQAKTQPDKEFIIYADRNLRFTYRDFDDRVSRLAKGLIAIGVEKGDHVGIWANNVPDWLTFMFATARAGAVLVTVNTAYKLHELEYLVRQADLKTLCIVDGYKDSDYVSMVFELIPELKECERGRLSSGRFPVLKNLVYIGPQKHRGMFNTQELLLLGEHVDEARLSEREDGISCYDVVNMQYTSGTTGFPKGVMLTHHNILNDGFFIGEAQRFSNAERVCLPVPLFHCFGCVLGVMAVITHGATLVMLEDFDPLLVLASIQKEKCTAVYGVPTMFIAELSHPMFPLFDLRSLRTGIMAGSPCPMELMKRVINEMHCTDITIAYGLTETSPVMTQTTTDDPIDVRVSTVGKPLPFMEVKIVDPETGADLPDNTNGEIVCRGFNVMKGYYNMPEATAQVLDKDGFLHSGDMALRTPEGYFKITGRIKDMIIRGGENIYPREVEEFLYQMPQVKDVQVVGIESEKYGEEVGAFIILKKDAKLTPEEVKDFCRGQISKYKIPKYVFFVNEYPQTASGKIQKYKLREIGSRLAKEEAKGS